MVSGKGIILELDTDEILEDGTAFTLRAFPSLAKVKDSVVCEVLTLVLIGVESTQVFYLFFLLKNSLLDHTLRPTCNS